MPIAKFHKEERDSFASDSLEELFQLLPLGTVENAVVSYLNSKDVRRWLPRPRKLRELARRFLDPEFPVGSIEREGPDGAPPRELVREETRLAAKVLLEHWLSGLGEAWQSWGTTNEVPLTNQLLPDWQAKNAPGQPIQKSWEIHAQEALDVALRSLAVTKEDVGTITNAFCKNVVGVLNSRHQVPLPDRFALVFTGNQPALVNIDKSRQ